NALYQLGSTSTGSPKWFLLGGVLTSRPGAAAGVLSAPGGAALDVVARGTNGAVWDLESTPTTARPWLSLGGRTLAGSGPAGGQRAGGGERRRRPVRARHRDRRIGVGQAQHRWRALVRLAVAGRPRQR